jgi:serpin B
MRSKRLTRGAVLLLLLACASCSRTAPETVPIEDAPQGIAGAKSPVARETQPALAAEDRKRFGDDGRQFAFELYRQVASGEGNVFVSPYGVRVALGMLYAGAEGDTRSEMASALRLGLPEPALHAAFNATDLELAGRTNERPPGKEPDQPSAGDIELRVVNGAFGRKDVEFAPEFLDVLARHYGTGMFRADFQAYPERERMAINLWVEDRTADRIHDLLPEGSIDPDSTLVLVNAIYFKGSWLDPFDVRDTRDEVFHDPAGDVTVPMMNGSADLYVKADGYQALELPYLSWALRILFVLPDEGRFAEIEAALDGARFDQIRKSLTRYQVSLTVPKFSFESACALKPALQALGMQTAFDRNADFSGIAGGPGSMRVDEIFQKTFIALDEQGTEAAAATAAVMKAVSAPPPAEFFLDRPFLFVIYDEPTGQVLFVGRLIHPK